MKLFRQQKGNEDQMTTTNEKLKSWVEEMAQLTTPDRIYWCDGSDQEYESMVEEMVASGDLVKLNQDTHPGCTLHRSNPDDVARVEHLTFICTKHEDDAGPNNNWMAPADAHKKVDALFAGCMKGRTMYVVPYVMGPIDSPLSKAGVELTDSAYVVANMRIMTRMGTPAMKRIETDAKDSFVKGLHSIGDLDPERRFIMHFPEERLIKSVGSGYGGNALLGKKCHALRIASWEARESKGWLAEHMLIVGIETPEGEIHYVAAAFPSACGKTNLAMLIPPASQAGYKVWTVGEDIAWMHLGDDGRLWAINPEAGMFGVAPGTGKDTNPNALQSIQKNTIYTNVAVTPDGQPWWEGLSKEPPEGLTDWQGRPYKAGNGTAAHPNSRFTVSCSQIPSYSKHAEDPQGVPISAILFGGRRASLTPLVYQSLNWQHGVFMGATVASETTAAITGQVGVVRRDPMAMLPFCGYNMGDYWKHWLQIGKMSDNLPKIFHVNWFRRNGDGDFMWPGFGDNLRVLRWVLERCAGKGEAVRTPIGYLPSYGAIDTNGLDVSPETMADLTAVDPAAWQAEMDDINEFFGKFGDRMPQELLDESARVKAELAKA
ncbi:MAG: phosphoenolpyruvate carboxykinase (GTP) [SAR324 cluster bacterium]|nr:phosphoenolpyruvate carboxykinase (GTP) [SAR324 cluster bacterium]